jgi:outer membrane protein
MTAKVLALRGAGALSALLMAQATIAQAQPAPARPAAPAAAAAAPRPAGPAITYGPPIAGLCVISTQEALGASTVGKAVNARMEVLKQQVAAELQPQATALGNEQRTLQQTQATMEPAVAQNRIAQFNLKANELRKLEDQRSQELQATGQKALQRLMQELQPVMQQAFQQKQCTILLERDSSVLGVNPSMDLTGAAVAGLNARIQTFTFDRERLTAQQPPAAAPSR